MLLNQRHQYPDLIIIGMQPVGWLTINGDQITANAVPAEYAA